MGSMWYFLNYLASAGFNVIAPVGWYVPNVPSFPLVLGALLKHGFLMSQVYLIGWSAGGVASAWALTHDSKRILNLAVIMDAELTEPTETGTHTDQSVFTTASISNQVSIPHLLVWGKDDSGTVVPNGVYFYKVTVGGGDPAWGKVMVIK